MRKKTLGRLYIIIGLFFSLIYPINSVLFNRVYTIGYYVPLEPLTYWSEWFWQYGLLTIILAVIGVYFVIIGNRYLKISPER